MAIIVANKNTLVNFQNATSGNAWLLLKTAALRSGIELQLGQLESFPRDFQTGVVWAVRVTVESVSRHILSYLEVVGM